MFSRGDRSSLSFTEKEESSEYKTCIQQVTKRKTPLTNPTQSVQVRYSNEIETAVSISLQIINDTFEINISV